MKIKKITKILKRLIINNFTFNMKEPNNKLSRGEAFAKEKEVYYEKDGDTWSVFGDETGFCYKDGIGSLEEAQKYVNELNANRKNL